MFDWRNIAVIAGLTLIPGFGYMWINHLADDGLAWGAFVGYGGAALAAAAAANTDHRTAKKILPWIAGVLLIMGLLFSSALDVRYE